jgi:hypothetical protein
VVEFGLHERLGQERGGVIQERPGAFGLACMPRSPRRRHEAAPSRVTLGRQLGGSPEGGRSGAVPAACTGALRGLLEFGGDLVVSSNCGRCAMPRPAVGVARIREHGGERSVSLFALGEAGASV